MINGRCPTCSRSFQISAIDELPSFPFCSERCRLIDLGRWIDGKYVVPGTPAPSGSEVRPGGDDADDSD
ncbi:MAG: DNA gyrase inhibitor YacG [Isosphaeraceae bacterium]